MKCFLPCLSSSVLLLSLLAAGTAAAQGERPHAMMLQYPDVGRDKIVFVFANDLWIVDKQGGEAQPLASPPGMELFPKFSPDCKTIAFTGNYDGDRDLYTIPVEGGVPFRVTHHPATEVLCDWTGDGGLLYYSYGQAGLGRMSKLYRVSANGGLPEALPVPYGADGAISPDGEWLCYTPHTRNTRTWKRYCGGMATDLWLFNLKTFESKRITDWIGTDTLPMWHGNKVYYLSDRGEGSRLNLWYYDTVREEHVQVTDFRDYDVKWPSIWSGGPGVGDIVFQNGPNLYLLDLKGGEPRKVEVEIPGARPTLRPQEEDASKFIQSWSISSTGKRAVVQARGDVWTLPAENGSSRNLTRTSGVAERSPSWSPDGRWIAYFSDATGEYELYITQSDGKGEPRKLTSDSRIFYYRPTWSPDSKRLLYSDCASRLHLLTVDSGETIVVDEDPWGTGLSAEFSHDGRWLAYARTLDEEPVTAIWLYDIEKGERHQVTSGMFVDSSPVFDRKGDYLFYASRRDFSPTYSDVDSTFIYEKSERLLAVPLLKATKSPWLPESDEETWKEEKKKQDSEGAEAEKKGGEEKAEPKEGGAEPAAGVKGAEGAEDPISGTWEGTAATAQGELSCTLFLTLENGSAVKGTFTSPKFAGEVEGTYDKAASSLSLKAHLGEGKEILITLKLEDGVMSGSANFEGDTVKLDLERTSSETEGEGAAVKPREKVEIDLDGFEARAMLLPTPKGNYAALAVNDKNQLLYVRRGDGIKLFDLKDEKKEEKTVDSSARWFVLSADGKKMLVPDGGGASIRNAAAGGTAKKVVMEGMSVWIDPRPEWRQIFNEAWRLERDFFYVDNMHGVDWPGVRKQYEPMLDSCYTRDDVSYVIREMISELNIGHAYYYGGDTEDVPSLNVGLLGADFSLEDGAYRFARIYGGAPWDADARNPLQEPGMDVKEGDYLLAVNGIPMNAQEDPWAPFIDLAGRTVVLTVSEKPVKDETARDVIVKPLSGDAALRYRAWIEKNRAYVEEKTGGQVGYLYVPNTGVDGQNDLVRQYFGQLHKAALIIDERWNGGGQIPDRFIELLNRPVTNYWARQHGKDMATPGDGHQGPKCMLINGLAGSGGDMFPWLFRKASLGKLIGTRTWGGLVGISGGPGLIDNARVTVPTFGFYETNGTWGVEGYGVAPDIEVIDDPTLMAKGEDPQLDEAITLMLEEIKTHPYTPPQRPAPPDRSGMGVREEDR